MKVSAVIPTYNSSATIRATLESVLQQTAPPDEILVLDDGSTDDTVGLLDSYKPRITLFQQQNTGVAGARNALCRRAQGELVAFLDHDDIWHPNYLEVQGKLFERYGNAAAFFTAHVNFYGHGAYQWNNHEPTNGAGVELIDPLSFFERYNSTTGPFGSMSYCCVPKRVLTQIGDEPFCISGVDDSYLCTQLPLLGDPVVFSEQPLVAYRITEQAQSTNKLKAFEFWVEVFERLEQRYVTEGNAELRSAFRMAFASKRRSYGKILMGGRQIAEARKQLRRSFGTTNNPVSMAKSLGLLISTYLPTSLQPTWPNPSRMNKVVPA